jgi:enoyl-CoA hydratase/carnithine racemase
MNKESLAVIQVEVDADGICVARLNRPGALNTLDGALVEALRVTFSDLADRRDVRAIVLTGAGERAFCVGADLKERAGMTEAQVSRRIADYARAFRAIERCPKPVICAINGYALGGGLELALTADLRVCGEQTKVGLTEATLGIIPGAGGTQRLPRLIGASRAKELIFTGARITGARAAEIGLVDRAVPAAEVLPVALDLARQTLKCAPIALAQAKAAIDGGLQADLETGLRLEAACYAITIPTEDRLEGLAAFKEKRAPEFKGR